ncbi:AraC family transcriptional regulator [Paenibacillus sp. FSL R10-2782]|uniref:helix-turn-helix transcriptional regulator n=1 Tax=Paenibacillus sp. FSL R10-2782 TaxID=2954661 RepID=UPI003158607C
MLKYYDFLFRLRSSEFEHHTPERNVELLFNLFNRPHSSGVASQFCNNLDGDMGILSDNEIKNLQLTITGTVFLLTSYLIDNHVNSEHAYSTGDFFIHKADTIKTTEESSALFDEMAMRYKDLLQSRRKVSYGYPIDKCIHYIEQKLHSPLTLDDIAGYMGMTPEYLTTLFKQTTGISAYQYVTQRKIEEAKDMLQYTSIPMHIVASSLGFNSNPHFSNAFKKNVGLTPFQFRKEHSKTSLF